MGHGPAGGSGAGVSIPGHSWFDAYSLHAQWAPVLFAIAPLAIAAPAVIGVEGYAGSAAMLACLPPMLAKTARDLGKKLEPSLWASWGGPPTTRLLRHRDRTVSEITKARYFAVLARTAGIVRPIPAEEAADPDAADEVYASAGDWLRPTTRAHAGTSLVAAKNAAYGFARNLLGVRRIGFALAVATALCMAALAYHRWNVPDADFSGSAVASSIAAVCAALWIIGVNAGSVRSAADAYALALLECCDTLPSPPGAKAPATRRKKAETQLNRIPRKTASETRSGVQE